MKISNDKQTKPLWDSEDELPLPRILKKSRSLERSPASPPLTTPYAANTPSGGQVYPFRGADEKSVQIARAYGAHTREGSISNQTRPRTEHDVAQKRSPGDSESGLEHGVEHRSFWRGFGVFSSMEFNHEVIKTLSFCTLVVSITIAIATIFNTIT